MTASLPAGLNTPLAREDLIITTSQALIAMCVPCCRLAQAIMQRAEVPLRPYLQRFLTIIIAGDPSDSELKDQRLDVIMQARPAAFHCVRMQFDHARMNIHPL